MNNLEKFINLLQDVLLEIDKERTIPNSIWRVSLLDNVVKPEMNELLEYAKKGKVYFKYGNKQRMLESTYYKTDTLEPLGKTQLGMKISKVQQLYNIL